MECPYLIKPVIVNCVANEKPYVPTGIQLEEFCRNKFHVRCPFFREISIRKHEKIYRYGLEKAMGLS
jgi:hypothetical protein